MANIRQPVVVKLRPPQLAIFNDPHRFKGVVAGRRFGKTFLSRTWLLDGAIKRPGSMNWYTAPTYRQAKQLMWRPLKELIPPSYIHKKDEVDMTIELKNKSLISLRGTDNPDSLRGAGLNRLVLDECAFMKREVWEEILRPQLSDKLGDALFITTPKSFNWFYDLIMAAQDRQDWGTFHYTTAQGGNVTMDEIEAAKSTLDPRTFAQEYEASFLNMQGRVYYAFDLIENMIEAQPMMLYDGLTILVGMDFNVDPMTAVVGFRIGDQMHIVDEVMIRNGNTDLMAQELKRRYPGRRIVVYPDPAADARHTNAPVGVTDLTILRRHGFGVMTPGHPHAIADKINMANAAFCNAHGVRRVLFARGKTKEISKALAGLTYKEGTNIPDKEGGLDHISDALAYLLCMEYPMVSSARRINTVGII